MPPWEGLSIEKVLDAITDGIYVLSPDGRYLYANNAVVQLSGFSKEQFFRDTVYEQRDKGLIHHLLLDTTLKKGTAHTEKQRIVSSAHPNGLSLMTTQFPIFDEKSRISYIVGVMHNMEDLQNAYNSLPVEVVQLYHGGLDKAPAAPIAADPKSLALMDLARVVAHSDASVLLTGDSGVGKEVWADFIHHSSSRIGKEMVKINCASLPDSLLEAELFGYTKGSFTGALSTGKVGLIEQADGGTLFLDEINSMPLSVQSKLLRVLESKTVRRIGSTTEKPVNFRLISATNEDLTGLIEKKQFRQDLYYRCNVVPLHIPPLRERRLDIQPLCQAFLQRYQQKYGVTKTLSPKILRQLEEADWPGNVRELKNFIERVILLTDPTIHTIEEIPAPLCDGRAPLSHPFTLAVAPPDEDDPDDGASGLTLKEQTQLFEQQLIQKTIEKCGSISKAAVKLGVDRSTLIRKMKK